MLGGVRNRKMRTRRARFFIEFARPPVEQNQWRARILRGHFDVLPTDPSAPASLQSLQRRFFCREARGIMLSGDCAPRFAIGALSFSEHTLSEARRAFDGFAHPANFDNVDTD